MAETVEKKYLVNFQDNLDKYAKHADDAARRVAELKMKISGLTDEQKRDGVAVEKLNAEYKLAQNEYRKSKKEVELLTSATKKNATERDKLKAVLTLETSKLKDLGDGYTRNAQGLLKLNPLYADQKKKVAEAKEALIGYDQALNDGGTNVGRYKQSITGAATGLVDMAKNMVGAGAVIAIATKAFGKLKDAIMSTSFGMDLMNISGAVTKQMFYDIATNARISAENIWNVIKATDAMNALRVEQYEVDYQLSKIQREINALMLDATDITKSDEDRMKSYNKVRELDTKQTIIETDAIKKKMVATYDLLKASPDNEDLQREVYALAKQLEDAYAKSDQAMRRVESQQSGIRKRQLADFEKRNTYLKEGTEEYRKAQDELAALIIKEAELATAVKMTNEEFMAASDAALKYIAGNEEVIGDVFAERIKSEEQANAEWDEGMKEAYRMFQENRQKQLDIGKNQDNEDRENKIRNLDIIESATISSFDSMTAILGEQSKISKGFAVSAAIMDTYGAANKVLNDPTIPSTFAKIAMMTSVILTGLANVKQILSVDTKGGASGSGSTVSSGAARLSAPSVQGNTTSILSPAGQIGYSPQSSSYSGPSANDIVSAMKSTNIIVTVEDINAKVKESNKVSVRATI